MQNLDFDYQIDDFMLYCRTQQLREKSMQSYEQTLRLFERWCVEQFQINKVDAVTEAVIRRYVDDLIARGKYSFYVDDKRKNVNYPERRRDYRKPISPSTINNYLRNLRVFFNWLERDYLIAKNPMKKIRLLKVNRKAKEYISDEDFKKLISHFDKSYFAEHRDYAMIHLMLDTGMRLGECSELLVDDVILHNRKIHLRAEITKGRRDRSVFFSQRTELILRKWIQYKDRYCESGYLFPVKRGGHNVSVSGFECNFKRYLLRAGLNDNISPHCLRNNFAKRCLMNGMDIFTLSKILGHSSVTVTEQAYLDLTDEDLGKKYANYSPISSIR
ncbi:MAG: site-specific integrase [Ruminococcaceae bacterium]|nr:site-specific integrase [Oscillospiraceae bacterium]